MPRGSSFSERYSVHQVYNITPDKALQLLIEGNKRFVEGKPTHPNTDVSRRNEVTGGQSPFAVILTCADSRVPPEIIFDQGIGDLFIIRVAGNVNTSVVRGSIVLAVKHLGCPLVVIMGHRSCSAVSMCFEKNEIIINEPPSIKKLIETLRCNIPLALEMEGSIENKITAAITENTKNVADNISEEQTIVSRIAEGKTVVKPALYSLEKGDVSWL